MLVGLVDESFAKVWCCGCCYHVFVLFLADQFPIVLESDISCSFQDIRNEESALKSTRDTDCINWKSQGGRGLFVAPPARLTVVLSFVDKDRATWFCFERIYHVL
jgi:hypothetical protein